MKIRIPFVYVVSIIVVFSLAIYMLGFWMEWMEPQDTVGLLQRYLFAWGIVIAFAILGGIFFGMIYGHRILSIKGFTPIEKSMLEATLEMKNMSSHKENLREISNLIRRMGSLEMKMDLVLESQGIMIDEKEENDGEPGKGPGGMNVTGEVRENHNEEKTENDAIH